MDKSESACVEALSEYLAHPVQLFGGGFIADRVRAHDLATQRTVAHEEAGVHAQVALKTVEVLAGRVPTPVDALFQSGQGHTFNPCEHRGCVFAVTRR